MAFEAGNAIDRFASGWFEGYTSASTALFAFNIGALSGVFSIANKPTIYSASGATAGNVGQFLLCKKLLFSGGKYKNFAAVYTGEGLIFEFHFGGDPGSTSIISRSKRFEKGVLH